MVLFFVPLVWYVFYNMENGMNQILHSDLLVLLLNLIQLAKTLFCFNRSKTIGKSDLENEETHHGPGCKTRNLGFSFVLFFRLALGLEHVFPIWGGLVD